MTRSNPATAAPRRDQWQSMTPSAACAAARYSVLWLSWPIHGALPPRVPDHGSHTILPATAMHPAYLPESDARHEAIQIVIREWAEDDAVAATGWLAGLPPGAEKDTAAASLVPVIAPMDQSGALVWVAAISDEKLRMEALQSVKSLSPFTAADRWRANVEAAPLSDEVKAVLLSR